MAPPSTTTDVFSAVAEPQRRAIIALLARGERSVNEIADALRVRQPQASKHLRVLREVGVVSVRGAGQQRLYRLNGAALKPIHDWAALYQHYWNEQLNRLDEYLRELQQEEREHDHPE